MKDFKFTIDEFCERPSEQCMETLCSMIKNQGFDKNAIAELTNALAKSGEILNFEGLDTADVPSSGGPSSLSTIICPLVLKEYFAVPKLGIVGRPAGGTDVLSQIEGYKLKMSQKEILKIIDTTKYCHFLSNGRFAPLDNLLFRFRSENNYKNIPGLVIASLLSKKVAVGVKRVCLDVRYSSFGNFGKSLEEATGLSDQFKQVGNVLNVNCLFYFSDNSRLFQPYIGRGESLLAIYEYISNSADIWLKGHIENECKMMVESLIEEKINSDCMSDIISKNFLENIEVQGGSLLAFEKIVKSVKGLHIYEYNAERSGILNIDIALMRDTLVSLQNSYKTVHNEFPDPCGLIFKKNHYEKVCKGETLLTFRVPYINLKAFEQSLRKFIIIK